MNRRDFIKAVPPFALATSVLGNTTQQPSAITYPAGTDYLALKYPYYVNCYIQNQKYWPLEEYKEGAFGERQNQLYSDAHRGMGEKWIDGKLHFWGFGHAVDFIECHSRVVNFESEIAYEVFHERTNDPLIAPKHIYNYWAKTSPLKEIRWIHPDYIDHEADGGLVEYV